MPLDTRIALAAQGAQSENPVNQMAALQQLRTGQMQQQNMLMQQRQQERDVERQGQFQAAMQRFNPSDPESARELFAIDPGAAASVMGSFQKMESDRLAAEKTKWDMHKDKLGASGLAMRMVVGDPSDANMEQAFKLMEQYGVDPSAIREQFASMPDLAARKRLIQTIGESTEEGRKALEFSAPKPEKLDLGGKLVMIDTNPFSPTYRQRVSDYNKSATPDAVLSAATSRRGQDLTAATSRRGQDMVAAAAEARLVGSGQKAGRGTEAGKKQLQDLTETIRGHYKALDKSHGITKAGAGAKNVPRYLASSALGQEFGKAFGTDNQSTRNKIRQARPLLLNAVKEATGMSSKQMDSNVELKMYLAAATDPTLDVEANMEALDNLQNLYGLGAGVGGTGDKGDKGDKGGGVPPPPGFIKD